MIEGSFAIIPSPVQGASNNTLSKELGKILGYLRPSLHVTVVLVTPSRYRLYWSALSRYFLRSFAKIHPVFFMSWAIYVVFPPGAEAKSKTLSPG